MEKLVYDVETFPNIFMITFIDAEANPKLVDAYEKAAILGNMSKCKMLEEPLGVKVFIIAPEVINELPELLEYLKTHRLLIGYNNTTYDNLMLDYLCMWGYTFNNIYMRNKKRELITDVLYNLSVSIIDYGQGYDRIFKEEYKMFKYNRLYYTYDIQRVLRLDRIYVSLKQVAILLKWYLVQDLPFNPHEWLKLTPELIEQLRFYNINDCLITKKVIDVSLEEIQLRENVSQLYGINVRNESRSGIANKYFIKTYANLANISQSSLYNMRTHRTRIKVSDLICDKIKFNSSRLQDILWILKQKVIIPGSAKKQDKLEIDVAFNNKLYNIRTGGLHSKDAPGYFESDEEWIIVDSDVTSYYPYIMLLLEICPEHLDKELFMQLIKDIIDNRVSAKSYVKKIEKALKGSRVYTSDEIELLTLELNKVSTKAGALKIVINSIYGKMGDQFSPLYDLKAMYKTTINGQLLLLMFLDMVSKLDIKTISANTDGVTNRIKRKDLKRFYEICAEWEEITGFKLEHNVYEKYVCSNVNNYIAIKEGFSKSTDDTVTKLKRYIKLKGIYSTELQLDKGYFAPVIAKAVRNYYCFNIPTIDSLYSNKDIYDFCISKKTNDDFFTVFTTVDKETKKLVEIHMQKNNRFYIAEIATGGLTKKYKNPKRNKKGVIVKEISMVSKQNIQPFNKFIPYDNFEDYNIKYRFYYTEIQKIVIPIEQSKGTLFQ